MNTTKLYERARILLSRMIDESGLRDGEFQTKIALVNDGYEVSLYRNGDTGPLRVEVVREEDADE